MSFLTPLALLAVLPWLAVVVWMLTGQWERTAVPFLELWRGEVAPLPKARAAVHVPPVSVVLLLGAAILAILAAARPWATSIGTPAPPPVVLVVDHGFSMSDRSRWEPLAGLAMKQSIERFGRGVAIATIHVPDAASTGIDTRGILRAAVGNALAEPGALVWVVTDQTLAFTDPRLIQLAPDHPARNVGFVLAAAGESPGAQVMVRVRNDSPQQTAALRVGGVSRMIELPPAGHERNYFIDLPQLEQTTSLVLDVTDDVPQDNELALVRTPGRPRLELTGSPPPEIVRMADVYTRLRAPHEGSPAITVATGTEPPAGPGIWLAGADRPGSAQGLEVQDHFLTSAVDWGSILAQPFQVAREPGPGWTILMGTNQQPILAVREQPARQVWVGFASEAFGRTADFVIFGSNLFDYFNPTGERFITRGTLARPIPIPPRVDWPGRLDGLAPGQRQGRELSSLLVEIAALLIFTAALLWGVAKTAR